MDCNMGIIKPITVKIYVRSHEEIRILPGGSLEQEEAKEAALGSLHPWERIAW